MDKPKDMSLWSDQGNCRTMNPSLFFTDPPAPSAEEACETCPVWKDCQTWAIYNEGWGYWGRTTGQQRKRLRSKLNIALNYGRPVSITPYKIRHGSPAGFKAHLKLGQSPPPLSEGGCGCYEAWSSMNAKNKVKAKAKRQSSTQPS